MPEHNERNRTPRRKPKRQPVNVPLISIVAAVVITVIFTVALTIYGGSGELPKTTLPPIQSTQPSTQPTDEVTEPSTEPTEPPITVTGTATIGATGDMLMHMPCVTPAAIGGGEYDFTPYFTNLQSYVQAVDYAVANLETTLAGTTYKYSGYPNFNCPDGIVPSLRSAGFDMLLTANNHTYDTGTTGFFRTQEVIAQNGLDHIGTKPDEQTDSYLIKDINGISVGMINYTYETNSDPNKVDLNGGADLKDNEKNLINVFLKDDVAGFTADLQKNVTAMKDAGAEAIVLYIHWGEEYQLKQNKQQEAMAQAACDLGVDVIVGGHPHVIQPIDLLTSTKDENHKTVCLYSTGNALSNQRLGNISYVKTAHTEDGIFFTFSFVKYSDGTVRVENVEALPLWVNLYTSAATGKNVYDILPLDKAVEDWKSVLDLTNNSLTKAENSYERTMKIVGEGLKEVQDYLSALPEIAE